MKCMLSPDSHSRRNRGLISGAYVLLVENLVLICNSISQIGNIAEGHLVLQYCLQFFKKTLTRWANEPNSAYQGFANLLRERNRGKLDQKIEIQSLQELPRKQNLASIRATTKWKVSSCISAANKQRACKTQNVGQVIEFFKRPRNDGLKIVEKPKVKVSFRNICRKQPKKP